MDSDGKDDAEHYVEDSQILYVSQAVILVVYIVWTYLFEHQWIVRWLHQTTVATLLGVLAGALLTFDGVEASLDPSMVLNVCLPLIIIDAGYNLNVWDFYDYWVYIVLLGVFGTLGIFSLVSCYYSGGQLGILTDVHAMTVALVFSASDTVAPLTLLPHHKHRKLNAIVFGEAIMNDVVCLFLATSVRRAKRHESRCLHKMPTRFTFWKSSGKCAFEMQDVIFMALVDIVISTLLGLVWGMLTSWTLGVFRRVFREGPVSRPCLLVFLSCYVAYAFGDLLNLSGVMVMFVCAVVCKLGVASNLHGGMADLLASVTQLLGFSSESFLFGYFGMSLVKEFRAWHELLWSQVGVGLLCVFICRLIVISVARILAELLSWSPHIPDRMRARLRLSVPETVMVATCGMVRGVIAVVLLLTLEKRPEQRTLQEQKTHQVLMLVMTIHILAAGPLMSFLKGFLKLTEDKHQDTGGHSTESRCSPFVDGMKDLVTLHGQSRSSASTGFDKRQPAVIEMVDLAEATSDS